MKQLFLETVGYCSPSLSNLMNRSPFIVVYFIQCCDDFIAFDNKKLNNNGCENKLASPLASEQFVTYIAEVLDSIVNDVVTL